MIFLRFVISSIPHRQSVAVLLLALVLPPLGAWSYYVVFSGSGMAGGIYALVKVVMVLLAVMGYRLAGRGVLRDQLVITKKHLTLGLLLGVGMMTVTFLGFVLLRQAVTPFAGAVAGKTAALFPLAWYPFVAILFSLLHAFFEEWYWRGFVFWEMKRFTSVRCAIVLSAAGFTAHHIIVLSQLFPMHLVIPMSLGIFLAGAVWASLVQKTGSLTASWISHVLADLAIFAIGAMLIFA